MDNTTESRSFSYSVFYLVTDEMKATSVPVGVALWGSKVEWVRIRLLSQTESVRGVKAGAYPFIRITEAKVKNWISGEKLSYSRGVLSPHTDEWWRQVSKLLVHSVKLSEPRPIACNKPEDEIELLYEALVGPNRHKRERRERIDGVLTKSLGTLSERLGRVDVIGFGGRAVSLRRCTGDRNRLVVVEAVNLASPDAELDADALVSRLQRVQEPDGNAPSRSMVTFVGYLASPDGLNGEAALVRWIEKKVGAETFDLLNQREVMLNTLRRQMDSLEPPDHTGGLLNAN